MSKVFLETGKCGVRQYPHFNKEKVDMLIKGLQRNNYEVEGNNPWLVDVGQGGVVLKGSWDESASMLSIIVEKKGGLIPCSMIWNKIEPLINSIGGVLV